MSRLNKVIEETQKTIEELKKNLPSKEKGKDTVIYKMIKKDVIQNNLKTQNAS